MEGRIRGEEGGTAVLASRGRQGLVARALAHSDAPSPHLPPPSSIAGRLLQLDGRRPAPIDCGATSEAGLLKDTAAVVQRFAEITNSISFNLIALAAGDDAE